MHRFIALMFLTLLVAGCSSREVTSLSEPVARASAQTVFFATQRNFEQIGRIFGEDRLDGFHFGEMTVSIPPNHEIGRIEWRSPKPNPEREFAVVGLERSPSLDRFSRDVRARQTSLPGETVVFIHGYNTTAAEAVFRLAQIQEDLGFHDPGVLFTWPSAGRATGYVYDRDSVLYARDDLVALLDSLTRANHRVILVAHSLGSHLAMEALRQARLTGNDRLLRQIAAVVLMSPDIDTDVFRRQAKAVGTLPEPFFVLSTSRDRALGVSSALTGRSRLGRTLDGSEIGRSDVVFLDFSDFATGQRFNHLVPITSPTAVALMRALIESRISEAPEFNEFLTAARSRLPSSGLVPGPFAALLAQADAP